MKVPAQIKKLKSTYLTLRVTEILLLSIAIGLVIFSVLRLLGLENSQCLTISIVCSVITLVSAIILRRLHQFNERKVIQFINAQYPDLQESADLLLIENNSLNVLQQIQKEKVWKTFNAVASTVTWPHRIGHAALFLTGSVALTLLLSGYKPGENAIAIFKKSTQSEKVNQEKITPPLPASISTLDITIAPPAYTNLPKRSTSNPNLHIAESSKVVWSISFNQEVSNVKLIFTGKDSVALKKAGTAYQFGKDISLPTFYQISWIDGNKRKSSDYYKIDVDKDATPTIAVKEIAQFTQLTIEDKLQVNVPAVISDDYGLTDAYIIATVSKGSGESVKFREEKLPFTNPDKVSGKKVEARRIIDIMKLGLEPGDELYFYIEAIDNKQPLAHHARTETYFIALQDTASDFASIDPGLGVDLMPEYFRSQRQIIIDSEKLLKEKKNISEHEFKSRSNELGYDQKVLRLKYGEFLGEEFESAIGPQGEIPEDVQSEPNHDEEKGKESEELLSKYGHAHDKDNEHNLVPDKKRGNSYILNEENKQEDLSEEFKHEHDDPEEATFFSESIRAKLKAALMVMWDAELHLRLFTPEKSLPYQYQALKLLKEISNDSRIYVHKTGFDPPPIKEEKRLTGDLTEIKTSRSQIESMTGEINPAIRQAIVLIEDRLKTNEPIITASDQQILRAAGNELAAYAIEKPGKYLETLSMLKSINENEVAPGKMRSTLIGVRKTLWAVLPKQVKNPEAQAEGYHSLDRTFLHHLETLKNE